MAFAHHHAAEADQNRGGESELFGAEQSADDHVAAGLELTVDLKPHPRTKLVEHQRLLCFGKSQLPRQAGMLDAGERRSAGAAVMPTDQDHVGVRLGDACGDGADPDLGNQLDRHPRRRIGVAQIVDELCEVFDRIDVVMRRRRDQRHIRHRMADTGDEGVDLVSRQLTALAGLRTLRHLDLKVLRVAQVVDGHAEAAAGDLLDCTGAVFAVRTRLIPVGILSALAAVAHRAEAVHRNCDRLMRLRTERTERHRAGDEVVNDRFDAFDLLERHRLGGGEFKQSPQCAEPGGLLVDEIGVDFELFPVSGLDRLPESGERFRSPEVIFAVATEAVLSAIRQQSGTASVGGSERLRAPPVRLGRDLLQSDAADPAGGAGEIAIDQVAVEADRFEHLTGTVAAQCGNAHLGHHFEQPLVNRVDVIPRRSHRVGSNRSGTGELSDRLQCEIGIDRRRTEAEQQREMHDLAHLARLDDDARLRTESGRHQRAVDRRSRQKRRNRRGILRWIAVGENEDSVIGTHRLDRVGSEFLQRKFQRSASAAGRELQRQQFGLEVLLADRFEPGEFIVGDDRTRQFDQPGVERGVDQNVAPVADVGGEAHHQFFTDRVDRRIGHLGEELLEVVEEQLRPA